MFSIKKISLPSISILIIAITCLLIDFDLKLWEKQDRVIEHDVHWYYSYLPSQFIYDDIKQEKSDYRFGDNYYLFWPLFTEDGKKVNKTTMGLSIMYAPFFFVAHAYTTYTEHYPANGFSEPYKLFLLFSAIFYLIIGLDFIRKILQHYQFSDKVIAITLFLIGMGTNLLCYSSQSATMSHAFNFCLFAVFFYYTIQWYAKSSVKHTIILGLTLGLISLIRPSNALIVLFFALYGIGSLADFKERIVFAKEKWLMILLMAIMSLLVWVPQFMYWKIATGHYLFYSYTDERFYFNDPHILEGLFSFRKGWLVYTPIMTFALLGLFLNNEAVKKHRIAIISFMAINIYIIFSWWCWWYGGTYGQRSMIESYVLLALPFASFIQMVLDKKIIVKILFFSSCLFFVWLNIFQTYQFERHSLHYEGMTKELYFKQFGKLEKIENFESYLHYPNYDEARRVNKALLVKENKEEQSIENIPYVLPDKKIQSRKQINLIANNKKFVCADGGLNYVIIADKDNASTWEQFELIEFEDGTSVLIAYNNCFISAELNSKNELTATRKNAWDWETFIVEKQKNNTVALKASNGKYVCVDKKTNLLFATSDKIEENTLFSLTIK
ncbi:MAG: hypothetical protein JNL69_02440 [Bacteroidia bacterium]|nr:hypothetical protein [Bacteroidia bacterium]